MTMYVIVIIQLANRVQLIGEILKGLPILRSGLQPGLCRFIILSYRAGFTSSSNYIKHIFYL